MKISTLIYCTKEGMRNIIRNIWFSLASVAIISACIFLFCMFFGLIANVYGAECRIYSRNHGFLQ